MRLVVKDNGRKLIYIYYKNKSRLSFVSSANCLWNKKSFADFTDTIPVWIKFYKGMSYMSLIEWPGGVKLSETAVGW